MVDTHFYLFGLVDNAKIKRLATVPAKTAKLIPVRLNDWLYTFTEKIMKYKAEVFGALCSLATFVINGVDANADDFVDQYDHSPDTAEDYACGDMQADIKPATDEILKKYNITADEYQTIAEDVSEKLSFGCCGWCV